MRKLFLVYILFIVLGGGIRRHNLHAILPARWCFHRYHWSGRDNIPYNLSSEFPPAVEWWILSRSSFGSLNSTNISSAPWLAIDTILISSASWDTLPGRYYLYPAQSGSMEDSTFTLPNPDVYISDNPFPSQPVAVSRQGTAMGYSVASLSGTPIRYIPADSLLMILTSVTLNIQFCASLRHFISSCFLRWIVFNVLLYNALYNNTMYNNII